MTSVSTFVSYTVRANHSLERVVSGKLYWLLTTDVYTVQIHISQARSFNRLAPVHKAAQTWWCSCYSVPYLCRICVYVFLCFFFPLFFFPAEDQHTPAAVLPYWFILLIDTSSLVIGSVVMRPIITQLDLQSVQKVPFGTFAWAFAPNTLEIGPPRLRMTWSFLQDLSRAVSRFSRAQWQEITVSTFSIQLVQIRLQSSVGSKKNVFFE